MVRVQLIRKEKNLPTEISYSDLVPPIFIWLLEETIFFLIFVEIPRSSKTTHSASVDCAMLYDGTTSLHYIKTTLTIFYLRQELSCSLAFKALRVTVKIWGHKRCTFYRCAQVFNPLRIYIYTKITKGCCVKTKTVRTKFFLVLHEFSSTCLSNKSNA